ncbi:MAG TPA: hypothetical protein VNZ47_08145 [Candidatus Dormibacteraeota bacterium]|jgi:hypothetical protein|nr:hypothetical protein [Candidatus Dormibacteraeota bacterium]
MGIKLDGRPGCAVLLIALLAPGLLLAYVLRSVMWAFWVPAGLIVGLLIIAALPIPRKVTPEEFANELERHLQGTEGEWDWDDATSVRIADKRLERLRLSLGQRFDMLARQEDRDELAAIIAALRRGEIPQGKVQADG